MANCLRHWLDTIGAGQYAEMMAGEGFVTLVEAIIGELSDADLKEIG